MSNVNSKEAKEAKYENKTMSNGKINKKYVDLLEEDKSIA